ncbi:type IX secretion system plug protein [Pedobacter duraquae]|uniref:Uncharacterized protein DUF5103 n=1 Tax=Pedobacter duraquae TaxID=425511 RepID=A0A4R6ISK8_9SPHI|nr:DUF5103 domain-containing protein [Pedobacter duraquae]TDO24875.1 uncharacterized protein DUF5103 [Pedobacter duraquae]
MKKLGGLLLILTACMHFAVAQQPFAYENKVYQPQIKTVICANSNKEQSLPVILLNSGEQIDFSFDDLDGGSKNYWYTIEHCTSDWKSSRLSPLDYLNSYADDRIVDYEYSSNTLQKFTHYSLRFPNQQIAPKLTGNYLLKVYLDGNIQNAVVSQRFYVVENLVNAGIEIVPSSQVPLRSTNQKINFTIFHTIPIQNPYTDIKAVLMQNGISQTAITNTKPTFVRQGAIVYNDLLSNDFPGGNEFRKFDIRSIRYKGEHVQEILRDTALNVFLFADGGSNSRYASVYDENGNFFIRNQDGRDQNTDSDYAHVLFTLSAKPPAGKGDVYVAGRFNDYAINAENKMTFDAGRNRFYTSIFLKQGVYDYKYFWKDAETGKVNDIFFEGSFFETDNTYQVFVYYRKPGGRWDELIGYTNVSNKRR